MKQYRYCTKEKECPLKDDKRCHLGWGGRCQYQGARIMIFDTKDEALKQVVEECK